MKKMKRWVAVTMLMTICGLPVTASGGNSYAFPGASYYQPQPGDAVMVMTRTYRAGMLPSAEATFKRIMPRLWKTDKRYRDTIIMVNEKAHTSLTLAVCAAGDPGDAHLQSSVTSELGQVSARPPEVRNYRLVVNRDERGYAPREGDRVAVWRRKFSAANYQKALKHYQENLFPHLSATVHDRDSLLVADDASREIAGFMFFRGEFSVSAGTAEKVSVLDGLSQGGPVKPVIYRIILVNNE